MCMEDVRIGRKTRTRFSIVPVAVTNGPLAAPSPHRIFLHFYPTDTPTCWVAMEQAAAGNNGIIIGFTTTRQLEMRLETHGDAVTRAWFAIGANATQIAVLEGFYGED